MSQSTQSPGDGSAIARWLSRCADNVAVALLAIMFVAFLLQIVFRYVLNRPIGWTEEVTVLCWVWVVLLGAAFVVAETRRSASTFSTTPFRPRCDASSRWSPVSR